MDFWGYLSSGVSAVSDWVSDTFFGGSKSSKLTAQLNDSLEQQKALLASYEGTVTQLLNNSKSGKYLPWILGGAGVLGALILIKGKRRVF